MCFACEGFNASQLGINPALAARARRIEAAMPGRKVADQAWRILLGEEGGSIPWPAMQRLMQCLDKAANSLCANLQCEAVNVGG
jgi:hypothetical protein